MSLARFFPRNHTAIKNCLPIDTEGLEEVLSEVTIGVYLGQECEEHANAWLIAEFLVNLLARLYPHIALISESEHVAERLGQLACRINPNILIDKEKPTHSIGVGSHQECPEDAIFPWASGWVAGISDTSSSNIEGPLNPYSSGLAAALSAGEVFKQVFKDYLPESKKVPIGNYALSLLDYGESAGIDLSLPSTDLAEFALVGIGAVGNPAVWALARHEGLQGKVWLVDNEAIELSNLQRYVLGRDEDATTEIQKVKMAERELGGTQLKVECFSGDLGSFAESFGDGFLIPTICVSVDNEDGRRDAQALLPRLIINGWTGDQSLGVSWHRFGQDDAACLSCLYQPVGVGMSQTEIVAEAFGLKPKHTAELWVTGACPNDEELAVIANTLGVGDEDIEMLKGKSLQSLYLEIICGETTLELKRKRQPVIVPLAHQSAVAGLLMAVELIKRLDPELGEISQPSGYMIWEDIFKSPKRAWPRNRFKVSGCICGDQIYKKVYDDKWQS